MATEGNIYKRRLFVCCPALEHVVPGGGPAYSRQRMAPHDARTKRCPTSPLHLTEGGGTTSSDRGSRFCCLWTGELQALRGAS